MLTNYFNRAHKKIAASKTLSQG